MKARDFIFEAKKLPAEKPRNFVAKNAKMGGAGAHKDKKKAAKQGDQKHKQKVVDEADTGGKIAQLESLISELEQLLPAVTKAQKNHYEFEEMEVEVTAIAEAAKQLSDRSATVDIVDAVEAAVGHMRQANAAIYNIEKTLKGLIKHTGYSLDDARDEAQYEDRFGSEASIEETSDDKLKDYKRRSAGDAINRQNIANRSGEKDPKIAKRNAGQELAQKKLNQRVGEGNIPFAGKKVGQKEGKAGQWRNDGPSKNRPARKNDLVG